MWRTRMYSHPRLKLGWLQLCSRLKLSRIGFRHSKFKVVHISICSYLSFKLVQFSRAIHDLSWVGHSKTSNPT
eukprot:jgi/Mesvir1/27205/Mv26372-RA.1